MNKEAEASHLLGSMYRNFGSISGPNAPAPFKSIGGPVTGSLIQSGLMGLGAYGLRRGMGWWNLEDPEYAKRKARQMAMLGIFGGVAANAPQFLQNYTLGRSMNWNPGRDLANAPPPVDSATPSQNVPTGAPTVAPVSNPIPFPEPPIVSKPIPFPEPEPVVEEPWPEPVVEPPAMEKTQSYFSPTYPALDPIRNDPNVPIWQTRTDILSDPFMSTSEKAKALAVLGNVDKSGLVSWNDLARGAVGAGVGYVAGDLFGRAVSLLFGRLDPRTQQVLRGAGVTAGVLRNTGVLQ